MGLLALGQSGALVHDRALGLAGDGVDHGGAAAGQQGRGQQHGQHPGGGGAAHGRPPHWAPGRGVAR